MSDKDLRVKIIRLAHSKPELRSHLLPLVTRTAGLMDEIQEFKSYVSEFYVPSNRNVLYPYYKGKKPLTESVLGKVIDTFIAKKNPQYLESVEREQVADILSRMGYDELLVDFKYQGQWEKMQRAKYISIHGFGTMAVLKATPYDITLDLRGHKVSLSPHMREGLKLNEAGGKPIEQDIFFSDIKHLSSAKEKPHYLMP